MALKSAILVLYLQAGPAAHLAAHVPAHHNEIPPGSEGVSPPRPCELVEGTTIRSCCSALSTDGADSPAADLAVIHGVLKQNPKTKICLHTFIVFHSSV